MKGWYNMKMDIEKIQRVLGFELTSLQKQVITAPEEEFRKMTAPEGRLNYTTTAAVLRILLSDGDPLYVANDFDVRTQLPKHYVYEDFSKDAKFIIDCAVYSGDYPSTGKFRFFLQLLKRLSDTFFQYAIPFRAVCFFDEDGKRQKAKDDSGKMCLTLVPRQIIKDIAKVREFGTMKYKDPDNWKNVTPEQFRDAAFRHFIKYLDDPKSVDSESGLPHLAHLACNIAFLCEMENKSH